MIKIVNSSLCNSNLFPSKSITYLQTRVWFIDHLGLLRQQSLDWKSFRSCCKMKLWSFKCFVFYVATRKNPECRCMFRSFSSFSLLLSSAKRDIKFPRWISKLGIKYVTKIWVKINHNIFFIFFMPLQAVLNLRGFLRLWQNRVSRNPCC